MRRLSTIVLVGAAAITVTVATGGSAYAGSTGGTGGRFVSPASPTSQDSQDFQDDMTTGCGSHRAKVDIAPVLEG
jgi:hypothetical protein